MLFRLLVSFIGLFALAAQSAHAQNWSRADSKHFIVYSDGSQSQLEDATRNLERLDALMRQLLQVPREENPFRLEIYLVRNQNRVATLIGDDSRLVAGFYRPTAEGTFIVAHRDGGDATSLPPQIVIFHEYAHHLMFRYFNNAYPSWYREGFAEYLSTAEFDDDGFTIGAPANHRAYAIKSGSYLDLQEVLSPPEDGFGSNGYMFYPQSWVLTHYLMADRDRNRAMLQYFARLASGMDAIEAAKASFGDLEEMGKEVEKYGRGKIEYRRSPKAIAIDGNVKVTALDKHDSALVEARLFTRTNYRVERTVARMRELAQQRPDDARVWVHLAEAERMLAHKDETFDFAAALAAVDKAIALAPEAERPNLVKAMILAEPADHEELDTSTVDWAQVRDLAITANKANADSPLALFTYVQAFQHEGAQMPEVAIPAMEQVFGTIPEVTNVRVTLAKLHANAGNYDRALNLVGFLVGDPHISEEGKKLVAEIEAMRDGRPIPTDAEVADTGQAGD